MKKYIFLFLFASLVVASPASARLSNDPYVEQWAYEDTGVYHAWDITQGSRNVVVAIIDNGFDRLHPDLRGNVWKNEDEIANNHIDDDENGYIDDVWGWNFVPEDTNGDGTIDATESRGNNDPRPDPVEGANDGVIHHGTVVAGILGAVGDNHLDGAGLNWRIRLMNVKVLDNGGVGNFVFLGDAIRYAVDNGADIINLSVVGNTNDDLESAIDYAYENGVVLVSAAGNDNFNLNVFERYPVCSDVGENPDKVIGVTAITEEHRISFFSNIGSNCIDLTAPGEQISSTLRFSPTNNLAERYGGGWGGTSFAVPLVSGTAALLKSIHSEWGPAEIYKAIISTVHHTPGQDEMIYANLFGAGLLQVDKALAYARDVATAVLGFGRTPTRILAIDSIAGDVWERNPKTKTDADPVRLSLVRHVDDIVAYQEAGASMYISAKKKDEKMRRIEIYAESWALKYAWDVPASGPIRLSIGDVLPNNGLEVVVADASDTDMLFRVYSLNGELLASQKADHRLDGVSIAIDPSSEAGSSQILVLAKEEDFVRLRRFSGSGSESMRIDIRDLRERGAVAVADIDADGVGEYIVGAGPGESAYMFYYAADGRLLRKFWAYDGGYQGGFSIDVADYNGDQKDDLITAPFAGNQPVRVWNYRSKKLDEWHPFGEAANQQAIIIPVF